MKDHDRQKIHSSEESDYRTPDDLWKKLDEEFWFTLDAAANKASNKCTAHGGSYLGPDHTIPTRRDGLLVNWTELAAGNRDGFVWVNPPYSVQLANAYRTGFITVDGVRRPHEQNLAKSRAMEIESWVEKMWVESHAVPVVAILPASIQTAWWRSYIWVGSNGHRATEIRHIPHRVSFLKPDGTPTGNAAVNHAIVVWRPNCGCIEPWTPHVRYWDYQ